jgi:hypothetical protein
MAAELPRPGVEVIQVFQTVTPTVITPTLVPCIVGVCRQVVDVLVPNATGANVINPQALVALYAIALAEEAVGDPPAYGGLDGFNLDLSLNNGPPLSIVFVGSLLSPSQIVAEVLEAFSGAGITSYTAEVVGTTQWQIRSVAANVYQSIEILPTSSPVVLAAFGFGSGHVYQGLAGYDQHILDVSIANFPNPNNNLDQLVIDPTTVRAFLFLGGAGSALMELLQTETFLQNGIGTPAVLTGTVDLTTLTYPTELDTLTLILTFNGAATPLLVTFATPANPAAVLTQINAVIGTVATATEDPITHHLIITTLALGETASILVGAGTANTDLGFTPTETAGGTAGVQAIDSGSGSATTTILQMVGANFTAAPTAAQVIGTVVLTTVTDGLTLILADGDEPQTLTFLGATTPTLILEQINALFGTSVGGRLLASLSTGHLALTNTFLGAQSIVQVIGGTALTALGLTAATTVRGNPFVPLPGDIVWIDGINFATITKVAPGGNVDQVLINIQTPISNDVGLAWYIEAENLNVENANTGVTRPYPNLVLDDVGDLFIAPEILRTSQGIPIYPSNAQLYVQYEALRLDVTAMAENPGLLTFSDTTTLGTNLAPVTTANPLALGFYFALLNAPNTQVVGIGVDSYTEGSPFGTVEAFTRAATFLESFEVYAIAPLTHDPSVSQVFQTHVDTMSEPENKGERIVLINPEQPTNFIDKLVASGINGNTTPTTNTFDTGVANLEPLLVAQGEGAPPYVTDAGVYLDIGNGEHYNIINVVGSVVTLKTSGFLPGENDDGYYAVTALPSPLISEPFAVRIRGAALLLPNGQPDLANIALTIQQQAQGYADRRVWQTVPDTCQATIGGLKQNIDGFYMNAAIAGMIANQPPQQSFTNYPMTGFVGVVGSNGYFSEPQLNIIAAGGNYIIVQDAPATPLISRMALTTDVTSIETRTDSITKIVDFCAKFLRMGLKSFIGRFNITQGFLDSLGHVIAGLLGFLADSGVLIGSNLNNIVQDTDEPDQVDVDVTLDVPFPCNYIRLTLTI